MIANELVTCLPKVPFSPSILQCDLNNLVVQVAVPQTDSWLVWAPVIVGALAAIVGATAGAGIGVWHSIRTRKADESRHLKERFAELMYLMDNAKRKCDGYYTNATTERWANGSSDNLFIKKPDQSLIAELKEARAEVSYVLGYLGFVAPEKQLAAAHVASASARHLAHIFSSRKQFQGVQGFWEKDYKAATSEYMQFKGKLSSLIQDLPTR